MLDFSLNDIVTENATAFTCPLTEYCHNNQSITAVLILEINQRLSPDFSTMEKFSKALGVSPKKLQRLLKDEGTSFSGILDTYRQVQTALLLKSSSLSVKEIATKLGYSSSESFNYACKRWFHVSPKKLRQ